MITYRIVEFQGDDEWRVLADLDSPGEAVVYAHVHRVPEGWSGNIAIILQGDGIAPFPKWWDDLKEDFENGFQGPSYTDGKPSVKKG
jgi:hypothetical protein